MENPLPKGAKGLAASSWATPTKPTIPTKPTPPAKPTSPAKLTTPAKHTVPTVLCKRCRGLPWRTLSPKGPKALLRLVGLDQPSLPHRRSPRHQPSQRPQSSPRRRPSYAKRYQSHNGEPTSAMCQAAFRWATPIPTPAPTKPAPAPAPAKSTVRVIYKESPRVTMENLLPPGAKGLAASRWVTPAKPTRQTKPAPIKPVESPCVTMVNPFPPGAKGLAASHWATPIATPTKPAPTKAAKSTVLCQDKHKESPRVRITIRSLRIRENLLSLSLPTHHLIKITGQYKEVPTVTMVNPLPQVPKDWRRAVGRHRYQHRPS
ncbi:hypothetical protein V8F33_014116 [Rhypophila sp. PSN 637]